MRRLVVLGWLVGLVGVFVATEVRADEVHLQNGSRLVGKVMGITEGKLKFSTDFAGELMLDMATVAKVVTDEPVNVKTQNGEIAQGKLGTDAQQRQVVQSEVLGPRPVELPQLASAWRLGEDSPEEAAAKAAVEAAKAQWTLRLEAGLNGETGNSERLSFNGGIMAKRVSPEDRLALFGTARYSRENGTDIAREFIGGALYEIDLTSHLFAFGRVELENDDIEDINLRATATVGLGYYFIRDPDQELRVRAGLGLLHESYRSSRDELTTAIAELGLDYRKEIVPWLLYTHSTTYYPTFDDLGDYRLVMENAAEVPLGGTDFWKLRGGVRNQYRGMPSAGLDRLETVYFLNAVVDF